MHAIDLKQYSGLRPEAWLCFDRGFSKEAIKEHLLRASEMPLTHSVLAPLECAARVSGIDLSRQLISKTARSEILRELVRKLGRGAKLPALARLTRQRGFAERLERAVSRYRMTFSHADEERVMNEFLDSAQSVRPLRAEVRMIAQTFARWLEIRDLYDEARVFETATAMLIAEGQEDLLARLRFPSRIDCMRSRRIEARERSFFEALSKQVQIVEIDRLIASDKEGDPQAIGEPERSPRWQWLKFHTPDDGADWISQAIDVRDSTVLFSDAPDTRRSLMRALKERAIELSDERDPTASQLDERIKIGFLPLKLVSNRFQRADLRALLIASRSRRLRDLSDQRSRGGKVLARRYDESREVIERFSQSKLKLDDLKRLHLEWLAEKASFRVDSDRLFAIRHFERLYELLAKDEEHLERSSVSGRVSYWFERLKKQHRSSSVPRATLAARSGLEVYRTSQATLGDRRKTLVLFGLEASELDARANGDYALSDSERNRLSLEFMVESSEVERNFRKERLLSWVRAADEVIVVDSALTSGARERESIWPVLEELKFNDGSDLDEEAQPIDMGATPRWVSSYQPLSTMQPSKVELEITQTEPWNATWLDAYSRCPFYALASRRWKLYDVREPTFELRPEVRGAILHRAVEYWVKSRNVQGLHSRSIEECLDAALGETDFKGTLESPFVEKSIRKRLLDVLVEFSEGEKAYFEKAAPSTIATETLDLEVQFGAGKVRGKPDRIDAYQDGIVVIDYKSSGSRNPTGKEILENEYGLQLPFYAIAASEHFKRKVYAQQFIVLARNGNRTRGVFPKEVVGKEDGKFIKVNSNSTSLTDLSSEEVLARNREAIEKHLNALKAGKFDVIPKIETKDCPSCSIRAVCGYNRKRVKDEEDVFGDS